MWVVRGFGMQNTVIPGAEILRINHVPVENIITRLLSFIPAEGNNTTTKYYFLNMEFHSYFNLIDNSESFQVDYRYPADKSISTVKLESLNYQQISNQKAIDMSLMPVLYPFRSDLRAAVIKVHSFGIQDIDAYIKLMDSIFMQIEKANIDNLVLDLRGNHGGHPIFAAILYSYLTRVKFTYFGKNEETPEFEPLYQPMMPNEHNFTGACYVLVDGGCLSTTGHLISLLKYHDRAVFIGEQPGSWFYCNDNSIQRNLPNTRLAINVPRTTFQTAVKGYAKGERLTIDYPVQRSIADMIDGTDTYMEYTLHLIANSQTDPKLSN
jgi:hypothetical protein